MNQKSFAKFQVVFGILTIIVFLLLIYGASLGGAMIEQLRDYPRSNDIHNIGLFIVFIMLIIAGILYMVDGVSKIVGLSKKFIPLGYVGSTIGIFSSFLVIINAFYSSIYIYVSIAISYVGIIWFLIFIVFTFLPYRFEGKKTKKQIKIVGIIIIIGIIIISVLAGAGLYVRMYTFPEYQYIIVFRAEEKPEVYVDITEEQMEKYPTLKKGIEELRYMKRIPLEERKQLKELLENNDTYFIKYNNQSYEIDFFSPD